MHVRKVEASAASRARDAMRNHEVLAAGTLSGLLGGAAMMAVLLIAASAEGLSPLQPMETIGETFVGPEALGGLAAKAAFGAILHALTSVAFGILFAGIVSRDFPTAGAMGLGVGVTLFAMGLMMSVVVPSVNPGFRAAAHAIGGSWVIAHAVFGATLGTAPSLRRWISRETDGSSLRPIPRAPGEPVGPATRST